MLSEYYETIFQTGETTTSIGGGDFILCLISALVLGAILACAYVYKTKYTKSFVITLAIIPAVVSMIIMMVNGNIGAGVAVAGAFSLIRFRSVPGTAKEIGAIFIGMGAGLAIGMGYIMYAAIFMIILCAIMVVYEKSGFGVNKDLINGKVLRITIPEDLEYANLFDEIFEKYTEKNELTSVKTTNMGSMFRLTYNCTMKDRKEEKAMIDELRCRNGNLEITMANTESEKDVL